MDFSLLLYWPYEQEAICGTAQQVLSDDMEGSDGNEVYCNQLGRFQHLSALQSIQPAFDVHPR